MIRFSLPKGAVNVGLMMFILLGCASTAPTRYYVLGSVSRSEGGQISGRESCPSIGIGPVKIPEYLDRSGIVTRLAPHELAVAEFNKWAEPIEENFPRVLAENLSYLLCLKMVTVYPWKVAVPIDYRVHLDVNRMDGTLGQDALLEVSWAIVDGADRKKVLFTKRSTYRDVPAGQDYGAFVAAQSRNLGTLGREIAEVIRTLAK